MKLEVGQSVFYVPTYRHSQPSYAKVEKVGRKWATLDNRQRIEIETGMADGGEYSSPGFAYVSEDEYRTHVRIEKKRRQLIDAIGRHGYVRYQNESVIDQIANLIGLQWESL
jgi:hypothetical protein